MTSLGGNVSAIKITADDIICNTLTTKKFVNRNINADAINFTTNLARMLVMKKYPASWINKTYITPHSFDYSLYQKNKITTI